MTRKGVTQTPWTTEDIRYLLEHAGIDSKRSICRHLKRSSDAVKTKARDLRRQGYALDLRTYKPLTAICPKCGCARSIEGTWTTRSGFCQVCKARDELEEARWRQAEAFRALAPSQRAQFDRRGESESALPARPKHSSTFGVAPNKARRLEELHAIEVERWELRCLEMRKNAVKSKTRRMRAVTGTQPRKDRKMNQT